MRLSQTQSRLLAIGLLLGFFLVGFLFFVFRQPAVQVSEIDTTSPVSAAGSETGQGSMFALNEFHRTETKDGRPVWEISAKRGEYISGGSSVRLVEPHLSLFRKEGGVVVVTAQEALVSLEGTTLKSAELIRDVRLSLNEQTTISTGRAIYNQAEQIVRAPGRVDISGDVLQTSGESLVGNLVTSEFRLEHNVETIISPRKDVVK